MDPSTTNNGTPTSISNKNNIHNISGSVPTTKNKAVKTVTAFGRKTSPASAPQSLLKRPQSTPMSVVKFSAAKSLSERRGQAFVPHSKKVKSEATKENGNPGLQDTQKWRKACEEMTVFVSNVPCEATEEDLRNHFMNCGEVVKVIMLQQLYPCLPKRGVNVEFATQEAAEKALMMSGTWLINTNLQVSPMEIGDESSQEFRELVAKVARYSKKLEKIQRKLYEVKHNVFCESDPSSMHREEEGNSSESSVHL